MPRITTAGKKFLAEVEAYITASGMYATEFGRAVLGDPNFVWQLREGREPTLTTIERVQRYIERNQPPRRKGAA